LKVIVAVMGEPEVQTKRLAKG